MKIFLSYRRADSQTTAGRMAQFLDSIPAIDEVFLDVDAIGIGENFEQEIRSTLEKATHVFLLIGTQWQGPTGAQGCSRILEPDDMVRQETRMALQSKLRVVPILLDAASMPRASELPNELKGLSKINAFSLRTSHFDEDMDDLLDNLLGNKKGRGSRWRQAPLTWAGITLRILSGLALGAALLIALALVNHYASTGCEDVVCTLQEAFGIEGVEDALGLMWMIVIAVLGLGAAAPFVPRMLSGKR